MNKNYLHVCNDTCKCAIIRNWRHQNPNSVLKTETRNNKITNSQNTKRTYGQPSEQLVPKGDSMDSDCKQSLRIGRIRAGCVGRLFGAATRHSHNHSDSKSNKYAMTRNWILCIWRRYLDSKTFRFNKTLKCKNIAENALFTHIATHFGSMNRINIVNVFPMVRKIVSSIRLSEKLCILYFLEEKSFKVACNCASD